MKKIITLVMCVFFLLNMVFVFPMHENNESKQQEEPIVEQQEDDDYDQGEAFTFFLALLFLEWYFSE